VKYAFTVEVVQFQETTSIIVVKHRFPSLSGRVHGGLRWRLLLSIKKIQSLS